MLNVFDSDNDVIFLNVSGGKFKNKKKEISADAVTGSLESITKTTDQYEGKNIEKIKIKMRDDLTNETYLISFTESSWFAVGFFQRVAKIDRTKKFKLGVMKSEKNEKVSFCWMEQDGVKIPKDLEYPLPKKIDLGGNIVSDYRECVQRNFEIIKDWNESNEKSNEAPF